MNGFLVAFNSSSKKEIVQINHHLFGRIVTTDNGRYYYCGRLENIPYFKLGNGCYFITSEVDNLNGLLKLIKGSLDLNASYLITAKEHWKQYSIKRGFEVKNL